MLALRERSGSMGREESAAIAVAPSNRREPPEIVLDLSRLLSRSLHPSPTGVDRVEMAYARTLMRRIPDRLRFGAVHPIGHYGRLPSSAVERFLDRTEMRWELSGGQETSTKARTLALEACWSLRPRQIPAADRPRILLQASPNQLDRLKLIRAKLRRENAHLIALVHDLIPITHPEYARPNGALLHQRRLDTLAQCASGLIVNSQATAAALRARTGGALSGLPLRVAPLSPGATPRCRNSSPWSGHDYFICVGTIEARKNHLLLLNLWRSLAAQFTAGQVPALLLVGRRGWENESVFDMLDRCNAFGDRVVEYGRLPDNALRPLIRDARALLMPSFAEGFGLPIAEALAAGVPVIASDIPAHREAGGDVPEYLDPLDGLGWREAVLDYYNQESTRRAAQLARLRQWRPVTWDCHIDAALALADEVTAC